MPGFGINRLWWPGGRYAYVRRISTVSPTTFCWHVDLKEITKPEIVSRWWLPGMHRAGARRRRCRRDGVSPCIT